MLGEILGSHGKMNNTIIHEDVFGPDAETTTQKANLQRRDIMLFNRNVYNTSKMAGEAESNTMITYLFLNVKQKRKLLLSYF